MFSWLRKTSHYAPEPEQPAAQNSYLAESQAMFAHLIAKIDAVDTGQKAAPDGRDAAGGVAIGR